MEKNKKIDNFENDFIDIFSLKNYILKKELIIKLIKNHKKNNVLERLRITILVNLFYFDNVEIFKEFNKRKILFLESKDHREKYIFDLFDSLLTIIINYKKNNFIINKNIIYNYFDSIEKIYQDYISNLKKENMEFKIINNNDKKYTLKDLFFIGGGYPL